MENVDRERRKAGSFKGKQNTASSLLNMEEKQRVVVESDESDHLRGAVGTEKRTVVLDLKHFDSFALALQISKSLKQGYFSYLVNSESVIADVVQQKVYLDLKTSSTQESDVKYIIFFLNSLLWVSARIGSATEDDDIIKEKPRLFYPLAAYFEFWIALLLYIVSIASHYPNFDQLRWLAFACSILLLPRLCFRCLFSIFLSREYVTDSFIVIICMVAALVLSQFVQAASIGIIFGFQHILDSYFIYKLRLAIYKRQTDIPNTASLLVHDSSKSSSSSATRSKVVNASDFIRGDVIVVAVGHVVPCDGVIISTRSQGDDCYVVDEKAFYRRNHLVQVKYGDTIRGGSIHVGQSNPANEEEIVSFVTTNNESESFRMKATQALEQSSISQIHRLLKQNLQQLSKFDVSGTAVQQQRRRYQEKFSNRITSSLVQGSCLVISMVVTILGFTTSNPILPPAQSIFPVSVSLLLFALMGTFINSEIYSMYAGVIAAHRNGVYFGPNGDSSVTSLFAALPDAKTLVLSTSALGNNNKHAVLSSSTVQNQGEQKKKRRTNDDSISATSQAFFFKPVVYNPSSTSDDSPDGHSRAVIRVSFDSRSKYANESWLGNTLFSLLDLQYCCSVNDSAAGGTISPTSSLLSKSSRSYDLWLTHVNRSNLNQRLVEIEEQLGDGVGKIEQLCVPTAFGDKIDMPIDSLLYRALSSSTSIPEQGSLVDLLIHKLCSNHNPCILNRAESKIRVDIAINGLGIIVRPKETVGALEATTDTFGILDASLLLSSLISNDQDSLSSSSSLLKKIIIPVLLGGDNNEVGEAIGIELEMDNNNLYVFEQQSGDANTGGGGSKIKLIDWLLSKKTGLDREITKCGFTFAGSQIISVFSFGNEASMFNSNTKSRVALLSKYLKPMEVVSISMLSSSNSTTSSSLLMSHSIKSSSYGSFLPAAGRDEESQPDHEDEPLLRNNSKGNVVIAFEQDPFSNDIMNEDSRMAQQLLAAKPNAIFLPLEAYFANQKEEKKKVYQNTATVLTISTSVSDLFSAFSLSTDVAWHLDANRLFFLVVKLLGLTLACFNYLNFAAIISFETFTFFLNLIYSLQLLATTLNLEEELNTDVFQSGWIKSKSFDIDDEDDGDDSSSSNDNFGTAVVPVAENHLPWYEKLFSYSGIGLVVAVGYMDPGNWATDVAGGAQYGYDLMFIILVSSFTAMFLQFLSLKLGIATSRDLAVACRDSFHPNVVVMLWLIAETAIAATELAELLGVAIALNLMLGLPVFYGVALTFVDVFLIMFVQSNRIRILEFICLVLISLILVCLAYLIGLAKPVWTDVFQGLVPKQRLFSDQKELLLAVGVIGATVMPHNLFLHSGMVQTRRFEKSLRGRSSAIRFAMIDSNISLVVAFMVNSMILILAAASFYERQAQLGIPNDERIEDIETAYRLFVPALGQKAASLVFGLALLAAGQQASLTGTYAGQIVMEGYIQFRVAPWKRRLVTRLIAMFPALVITATTPNGASKLLVLSQVILSITLPFFVIPLALFTSDSRKMGKQFVNSTISKMLAFFIVTTLILLNFILIANPDTWNFSSSDHNR